MAGHGREAEGLLGEELPQDVDGVEVLSLHRVLLEPAHLLPVLQGHRDLEEQTTHLLCSNTSTQGGAER